MGREKINYNDKEHTFKRMFGVRIKTFNKMKEILEKVLKTSPSVNEFIVIDVTESPVNRPKKTKKPIIQAKRNAIQ